MSTRPEHSSQQEEKRQQTEVLYVSHPSNKLQVVQVDKDGNLIRIIQTIEPVVDPLPDIGNNNGKTPKQILTEWMDVHPNYPLLYVITSFWASAESILTTYQIVQSTDDDDDEFGRLIKIGSCTTGGYEAVEGQFSLDNSTYVISHHCGGNIAFFDVAHPNEVAKLVQVVELPTIPGRSRVTPQQDWLRGLGNPCCHGTSYAPNGKYLVASDCMQNQIVSFPVDKSGRPPVSGSSPTSMIECKVSQRQRWLSALLWRTLAGVRTTGRPRRAVLHPSGKYLYVLHETIDLIQTFAVDEVGTIIGEGCLQEINLAGTGTIPAE